MINFDLLESIGFDHSTARKRFDNDDKFYAKCLARYIDSNNIEKLRKSIDEKRYHDASDAVHTLIGSSGNLALTRLYELYVMINDALKLDDTAEARRLVAQAERIEEAVREAANR